MCSITPAPTSRLGLTYKTWKKVGRYRVEFNNKPAGVMQVLTGCV